MVTHRAAFILACFVAADAPAEQFLTWQQAEKLCFPQAARFEEKTLHLTAGQSDRIRTHSGVKVRNRNIRIAEAYAATNCLGMLFFDQVIGKHDLIDFALALSPEGKVSQVEILEYREHYGSQVRALQWRSRFIGKTVANPVRLGKDIPNITGATLSCRHVTEGIKRLLATFDVAVRPDLPGNRVPDPSVKSTP